jgi:hypothetical protein
LILLSAIYNALLKTPVYRSGKGRRGRVISTEGKNGRFSTF